MGLYMYIVSVWNFWKSFAGNADVPFQIQEVFDAECVQLLMARAPKPLSQQGSERMGFTRDIVTSMLASLQPCIGCVWEREREGGGEGREEEERRHLRGIF